MLDPSKTRYFRHLFASIFLPSPLSRIHETCPSSKKMEAIILNSRIHEPFQFLGNRLSTSNIPEPVWFAYRKSRISIVPALLPLNGCRRFAGDIEADAVDTFDLVNDAGRKSFQDVVGELDPIGRHAVL